MNIVTIPIIPAFRGATFIRGRRLFQCRYLEMRYLLGSGAYLRSGLIRGNTVASCKSAHDDLEKLNFQEVVNCRPNFPSSKINFANFFKISVQSSTKSLKI